MSDDRARPPLAFHSPAPPAETVQKPGGRCLKCSALVLIEETFQADNGNGRRLHRINVTAKDVVGEVCGPVATALLFHVVAQAGGMVLRLKMPSLQHPEENYDAVVPMWERTIAASFRAQDEKGAVIVGAQPPPVVVTWWQHVGVQP